jgi:probable F420-dependent oxidoreductase
MQIGAVLPHNEIGTDPGAIKAYLQGLEALGVTHLLAYDHVLGVTRDRPGGFEGAYDYQVAFHEPLTFFAFAAGVTSTLELVSAVVILPQRQAVLVAKQAAEVAVLSGNRLRLGIGTGWNTAEYQALGVSFAGRGRLQAEQVDVMRRLWTDDIVNYAGEFHTIEWSGINPRPTAPIPIWFGGGAPAMLRRCAEVGDGWFPLGGANEKAEATIATMQSHRASIGRTTPFGIQAQAQFAGGTPERWQSHASKWRALGATQLAIATHNAGPTDTDGHLDRVRQYLEAVTG